MLTASQAYQQARPGRRVIGWKLVRAERDELLARFPPTYDQAVADHVTLRARVDDKAKLPSATVGVIVGRADDGQGVEAMVVQIDGSAERPDGSKYHITWSLGPGRKAVESNDVIKARGWEAIDPPVPVRLEPGRF
jgi:hypothetical protein